MISDNSRLIVNLVIWSLGALFVFGLASTEDPFFLAVLLLGLFGTAWLGRHRDVMAGDQRAWAHPALAAVSVVSLGLLGYLLLSANGYTLLVITVALIFAAVTTANNLTTGLLGYVDLSAAAVFAAGAYASALLTTRLELPIPLGLFGGLLAGLAIGGLVSLATTSLKGNEVAMATLAVTTVVNALLINGSALTGGPDGIGGMASWDSALPWLGGRKRADLAIAGTTFLLISWCFLNLRRARHWRAWIAVGDDMPAALSCGIEARSAVRNAFILGGAVTGLAGAEYAHVQGHIAPGNFGLMESVMVVCAVMLGGKGNIAGPAVAAAIIWIVPEQLQFAYYARMLLFGALLLVMLRFRPEGICPLSPGRYPSTPDPTGLQPNDARSDTPVLEVVGLSKRFDGFCAIRDVSFRAFSGDCLFVTGQNGSGKTLTMDLLTGYLVPSSGQILFRDQPIQGRSPSHIARLAIRRSFQESRLFGRLSLLEHALVGAHCNGRSSILSAMFRLPACREEERRMVARARSALAFFEGSEFLKRENDYATSLSFANRRRIEIARCLVPDRLQVLVLDEPFVGLSKRDANAIAGDLRRLLRQGVLLIVEHDLSLLLESHDRVLAFVSGVMICPPLVREDAGPSQWLPRDCEST